VSRFQLIADHSAIFEVKRLCELVEVERSCFYAWKAAAPACQARAGAGWRGRRTRPRVLGRGDLSLRPRVVYTSKDYAGLCRDLGVVQSTQP
jgi:hypothetical protein